MSQRPDNAVTIFRSGRGYTPEQYFSSFGSDTNHRRAVAMQGLRKDTTPAKSLTSSDKATCLPAQADRGSREMSMSNMRAEIAKFMPTRERQPPGSAAAAAGTTTDSSAMMRADLKKKIAARPLRWES